jgi:hypothetical protein
MSGEPIEFRAAKSGLSIADWLAARIRHDAVICAGAAVVLLLCGIGATVGTFGFFWGVFACGLGRWVAAGIALAIVAGVFVLERKYDGDHTEPVTVDAGPRGTITLRLSRLTGNSWLMFFDRPGGGDLNPGIRFITGLLLLAPRLFAVGRRMWERSRQMKRLDVHAAAAGLDALMQAGKRVDIGELLQEFPNNDPQRFVSDLTAVDGVVLLASEPPGLTLAPSVAEDYETWKKEIRQKRRSERY